MENKEHHNIALADFLNGKVISYDDLQLKVDKDNFIKVYAYTNFSNPPKRITEAMARQAISQSKEKINRLCKFNAGFNAIVSASEMHYYYCIDYHSGAQPIAKDINGKFQWANQ